MNATKTSAEAKQRLDRAAGYAPAVARVAVGAVFAWSGLLYLAGQHPQGDIASTLFFGFQPAEAHHAVGVIELATGITLIFGVLPRLTYSLLAFTGLGIVGVAWLAQPALYRAEHPLLLSHSGLLLVQHAVLVVAALGLTSAHAAPRTTTARDKTEAVSAVPHAEEAAGEPGRSDAIQEPAWDPGRERTPPLLVPAPVAVGVAAASDGVPAATGDLPPPKPATDDPLPPLAPTAEVPGPAVGSAASEASPSEAGATTATPPAAPAALLTADAAPQGPPEAAPLGVFRDIPPETLPTFVGATVVDAEAEDWVRLMGDVEPDPAPRAEGTTANSGRWIEL